MGKRDLINQSLGGDVLHSIVRHNSDIMQSIMSSLTKTTNAKIHPYIYPLHLRP